MYKIITITLAGRIRKVLNGVISKYQYAFVKERQILDCSLIANEVLDLRLKQKGRGMACKEDMMKAYDHVSWNFFEYVMRIMGFGNKWRWICNYIANAAFSVMVNESPRGFLGVPGNQAGGLCHLFC